MYEADGLGSVRGLLDVSGAKTDTYSYEAFGPTVSSTGTDVNPYRFAGERLVDSVGLYQNRARWLDTRTGRFVSVDPVEGRTEVPITFSPYLYGAGSPVSHVDPSGEDWGGVVAFGVAAVIVTELAWIGTQAYGNRLANSLSVAGLPRDDVTKTPEGRIAWGDHNERQFNQGVAMLVQYWWKETPAHDVWLASLTAKHLRNRSYGLSQDLRICAAERYLYGLLQARDWWPEDARVSSSKDIGYHTIKRIDPWMAPPDGWYPPSPYSADAGRWYDDGRSGRGEQEYGIVPPIASWNYWSNDHGTYRNYDNAGPVNVWR
jgi:RHS repeat-associated protein